MPAPSTLVSTAEFRRGCSYREATPSEDDITHSGQAHLRRLDVQFTARRSLQSCDEVGSRPLIARCSGFLDWRRSFQRLQKNVLDVMKPAAFHALDDERFEFRYVNFNG